MEREEMKVIKLPSFKAKGHGAWAWKKGMKANRSPKYVVNHRDEKHVWLAPRSMKRHRARGAKATMPKGAPVVITLADRKK